MPEGGRYYPRPESTEEAKARMMHMEAQLSQLTGKAINIRLNTTMVNQKKFLCILKKIKMTNIMKKAGLQFITLI